MSKVRVLVGTKKGAFIFGAKYGKGFVSCRKKDGVGWSAPGSIRVEGGSFGLQVGGSETDVFMLVMNASLSRFVIGLLPEDYHAAIRWRPGNAAKSASMLVGFDV